LIESETFFLTGCLDVDITVIEKSGDDPDNFRSNILDLCQLELGNIAVEESSLCDVNDPLICDDPSVKIKIEPENEEKIPDKKSGQAFAKKEKIMKFTLGKIMIKGGEGEINENKGHYRRDDQQQPLEKNEPMPSQKQDYVFVLALAGEMKFFVHDVLKPEIRRDLIPIDGVEENEIGKQKQRSADGVYKKHDHRGMAIDLVMKHMKNDRRAHGDIDHDQYGVKNSDYA